MNFSVIVFPGSNCDQDCVHVLRNVLNQDVETVFHKEKKLPDKTDCVVIPGGFSYGDYLRSGAICRFSNIIDSVKNFANSGGLVFGTCNGFQILCEIGLLPGALAKNETLSFICDDVYLKVVNNNTPFTNQYKKDEVIKIPIAHGDGRFVVRDLNKQQIAFKYCDKDGNIIQEANPNGSIENIAGIINESGNVLGMMPHPERASESILGGEDGKKLFESIIHNFLVISHKS